MILKVPIIIREIDMSVKSSIRRKPEPFEFCMSDQIYF